MLCEKKYVNFFPKKFGGFDKLLKFYGIKERWVQ